MGLSRFFVVAVLLCGDWNRKRGIGKALNRKEEECELCARNDVALNPKISNHYAIENG
jgi:hypothetical protein